MTRHPFPPLPSQAALDADSLDRRQRDRRARIRMTAENWLGGAILVGFFVAIWIVTP